MPSTANGRDLVAVCTAFLNQVCPILTALSQDGQSKDDSYLEGSMAVLSAEGRDFSHRLRKFMEDHWDTLHAADPANPPSNIDDDLLVRSTRRPEAIVGAIPVIPDTVPP